MPKAQRRGWTERSQRFAQEYLKDLNGAGAARRAGYSATRAKVTAVRLLNDPRVKAAVKAGQAKVMAKLDSSAERVISNLAEIANGPASIKTADKIRANELLGKYHKLFTDKVEHSGAVTVQFNWSVPK